MCANDDETIHHALIKCEHARSFWRSAEEYFGLKLPRLHLGTWSRDVLGRGISLQEGRSRCNVSDVDYMGKPKQLQPW
jgi:hypothetical protein